MTSVNIPTVPRVHIVGRKNSGKTTLVCELVSALSALGYRVATVKHTHHHHELDTPGKDSHKHRMSGAAGVGILSPQMSAAFLPKHRSEADDPYEGFSILFRECDVILVEGDLQTTATKIEVWRDVLTEPPYAASDPSIYAVLTDERPASLNDEVEVWSRKDLDTITSKIRGLIQ